MEHQQRNGLHYIGNSVPISVEMGKNLFIIIENNSATH